MGSFRTIIGCNFRQYETGTFSPDRYLVLDTQEEKSITAESTIAQQPLQSGDTMSDHMYRNPTIYNISGQFSLNGKNWDDDSYNFMEKGDRLTNIQEVFEYIKNNGILCTLTTIDEDDVTSTGGITTVKDNAKSRFKVRPNMALTSITWSERQNTVKYQFKFVEVIMVEKQEYEELSDEERESLGLPYVTSPQGSSLGTVLADTGQLTETVIRSLYDHGYIERNFFESLCHNIGELVKSELLASAIMSVGAAVAIITWQIARAITVGFMSAALNLGATSVAVSTGIFPIGTIIAGVAIMVVGLVVGIKNLLEKHERERKQRIAFKLINGSPEQDTQRLLNLLDNIEVAVNKVKSNLTIYTINSNKRQIVTINLAGEYYLIEFDQNFSGEWRAKVTDMEGNPLNTVRHSWCPVSSFGDLNANNNLWFKDKTKQYQVYLVNPSLAAEVNDTQEKLDNVKKHLEGYSIWVCKGDIQTEIKKVYDAIENAIESEGFI